MKILFISAFFPFPLSDGGRLRLFNIISHLAQRNEVHLISLVNSHGESKYLHKLGSFCGSVQLIQVGSNKASLARFTGLISRYPRSVSLTAPAELQAVVQRTLSRKSFDLVHVEGASITGIRLSCGEIPCITSPTDSLSLLNKHRYRLEKNVCRRLYYYLHWLKIRNYERVAYKHYDGCIVASEEDKNEILHIAPGTTTFVIPNGIDTLTWRPSSAVAVPHSILFTGVMSYYPNVDATIYFAKQILPAIREEMPSATLYIVGRDPTRRLRRLNEGNGVVVTGFVENIREYFNRSSIYVCPVRFAQGVKNKLLEAMAMAKPIVATPQSMTGLRLRPEHHLITARTPGEFAEKVIFLFNNPSFADRLGNNARSYAEKRLSWRTTAERLEAVYSQVISRKHRSGKNNEAH